VLQTYKAAMHRVCARLADKGGILYDAAEDLMAAISIQN